MKKTLKKIFSYLPFIILGLSMILVFQFGYAIARGEIPTIFNRAISYVPTPSMEDEILAGDLIVVHTKFDEIEVDDIISYHTVVNGREISVTHRVVSIDNGLYTTKGDNNGQIYEWEKDIEYDDIIGVYKGQRSHFLGSIYGTLFSSNINVLFILIIFIFIVIFALEIFSLVKTLQEKKTLEEKEKMIEEEKKKMIEEAKKKLRENGDQ